MMFSLKSHSPGTERPRPFGTVYRISPIGYFRLRQRVENNSSAREAVLYYNTRLEPDRQVIVVRLREEIRAFEQRTGKKLTYADLAERSGVARATVESVASRNAYNATLATIDKLCAALGCTLTDLVQYEPTSKTRLVRKRSAKPNH